MGPIHPPLGLTCKCTDSVLEAAIRREDQRLLFFPVPREVARRFCPETKFTETEL